MSNSSTQAANAAAERIVRHFQSQGFTGITEALLIQIHHIAGEPEEIDEAFEQAQEEDTPAPVETYFEIQPYGHYAGFRSFDEAIAALNSDFTPTLRSHINRVFFDAAPVVVDDPLASGTKFDALVKLRDSVDGYAIAILLNDPDASFLDYLGSHPGGDWQKIMGGLEVASTSLGEASGL